jgi:hypothetical protein
MHAAHRWLAGEAEDLKVIDPVEIMIDLAADASVVQVPTASLVSVHGRLEPCSRFCHV